MLHQSNAYTHAVLWLASCRTSPNAYCMSPQECKANRRHTASPTLERFGGSTRALPFRLGGCTVVGESGEPLYSWVDQGLCDVPDMNDVLDAL